MSDNKPLMTPEVMLGHWPKFFEKGLPNDKGESFYEADLLFSPEAQKTAEYARIKAACAEAVKKEWPSGPPANLRSPFRPAGEKRKQADGSQYYPDEQFAGWTMCRVKSKTQPGIINGAKQAITDESEIYGGAFVRCTLNPFAYGVKGNNGVSLWLNNVQKLRDGDPLGTSRALSLIHI